MIFSIVAGVVGLALGYAWAYLNLKRGVDRFQDEEIYKSQLILYMHLASDEMFRRRFITWAKGVKGREFVQKVSQISGSLVVLPIQDEKQMVTLMKWVDRLEALEAKEK